MPPIEVGPGIPFQRRSDVVAIAVVLLVNLLLQSTAAILFVRRYGRLRLAAPERQQRQIGFGSRLRLGARPRLGAFPRPAAALVWLTLRQTLPLCLPGLAVMCALVLAGTYTEFFLGRKRTFNELMPIVPALVTILWAVIVGAGTFTEEIDARVGESWRSWPVSAWRFFAIKYLVGLTAVLAVLDLPPLLVGWSSLLWGNARGIDWAYVECLVPLHAVLFSLAVAWSCILRRSTIGAMAALVTYVLVTAALATFNVTTDYEPFHVYANLAEHLPIGQVARYPIVIVGMSLLVVISFFVAGSSLARYQPRRQFD